MTHEDSNDSFRLVPIGRDGHPVQHLDDDLPAAMAEICAATVEFYERVGFEPPWIGYISLCDDVPVGGGGFVGPPEGGRVEIAYHTLPEHQSRGYATRTAASLIAIARETWPEIHIYAKTLPEWGPSGALLARLGFQRIGTTIDHEIGEAWAWLLAGDAVPHFPASSG
jgi:RimJ/RimL family protein N-acetyltransferase